MNFVIKTLKFWKDSVVGVANNTVVNVFSNKTTLTVNGKKVDPKSPEGKKILKKMDKTFAESMEDFQSAFGDLGEMFRNRK